VTAVVSRRYPPDPATAGAVREFLRDRLHRLGLSRRADDAVLLASELVTNVILHAHTDFEVRVTALQDGARVEVVDGSPTLPMAGTLATAALSGRGLMLVQSLSRSWGAHRGPATGKTVWFELSSAAPDGTVDTTEPRGLLAMWDEPSQPPSGPQNGMTEVVVPHLPVRRLLAAKAHMEDLLRELQLILLDADAAVGRAHYPEPLLRLARQLDAAARDFAEGRRQVKGQALAAAARGDELVTLRLRLPSAAGEAAARYRRAVDEAERLASTGLPLATAGSLRDHTDIRAGYLGEVIRQLPPAGAQRPPG
jgi:anti-sigma regulatory factor (Ser/Thr protein kinase)